MSTYEIIEPLNVVLGDTQLILGKHSGRNALRNKVEELGCQLEPEILNHVFIAFKVLADNQKIITDTELEALVSREVFLPTAI